MANICPRCMANMDMVGRSHRCVVRAPETVAPRDPTVQSVKPRKGELRATYKYRDPEKRRAYQRDLMRKRRGA